MPVFLLDVDIVRYPLRYAAYEWIKEKKSATDDDVLEALNKNGSKCSPDELDKVLMQLEILGLVTIRWVAKDKRRIEFQEKPTEEPRMPRISE
ncbi:MAG TPA: hypothetical protein VEH01_02485 [Nitrososphaerales archaeon]|nr:hypothetical protein [Nitrososphaerales archaeon]